MVIGSRIHKDPEYPYLDYISLPFVRARLYFSDRSGKSAVFCYPRVFHYLAEEYRPSFIFFLFDNIQDVINAFMWSMKAMCNIRFNFSM